MMTRTRKKVYSFVRSSLPTSPLLRKVCSAILNLRVIYKSENIAKKLSGSLERKDNIQTVSQVWSKVFFKVRSELQ